MATVIDLTRGLDQGTSILNSAVQMAQLYQQGRIAEQRLSIAEQELELAKGQQDSIIARNNAQAENFSASAADNRNRARISGVQASITEALQDQSQNAQAAQLEAAQSEALALAQEAENRLVAAQSAGIYASVEPATQMVERMARMNPGQRKLVLDLLETQGQIPVGMIEGLRKLPQDMSGMSTDQMTAIIMSQHRDRLPTDERAAFDKRVAAGIADANNPYSGMLQLMQDGQVEVGPNGQARIKKPTSTGTSNQGAAVDPSGVIPEVDQSTEQQRIALARDTAWNRVGDMTTSNPRQVERRRPGTLFVRQVANVPGPELNFAPQESYSSPVAFDQVAQQIKTASRNDIKEQNVQQVPPIWRNRQYLRDIGFTTSEIRNFVSRPTKSMTNHPDAALAESLLSAVILADDPNAMLNHVTNRWLPELSSSHQRWFNSRAAKHAQHLVRSGERIERSFTSLSERFNTNDADQ